MGTAGGRVSDHHGAADRDREPLVSPRSRASPGGPRCRWGYRLTGACGATTGDLHAVDGVDLEIGDGEFFSLIGPSGCGKTTTLRMIAGLVEPTDGRIEVHGRDVTALRAHKRPVNTVFQQYALFPHLNVFENVAFGLRERRTAAKDIKQRVGEMLELVDLAGRDRNRPSQLSGGQQQRVALACSLVLGPEVLLLDEPLGALDLKLRKALQLQLKRIQHEVGITFVYVTHDQEEAFFMSDRVAIMRARLRIEQLGTPSRRLRATRDRVRGRVRRRLQPAAGGRSSRVSRTASTRRRSRASGGSGHAGFLDLAGRPERASRSSGPRRSRRRRCRRRSRRRDRPRA